MRQAIERFFTSSAYAVIGVSADRKKFGNNAFRTMKQKDFVVFPVNPKLGVVEEETCYPSVLELPSEVKSVITVVPPQVTETIILDCVKKGIASVWMQPGSQSDRAIEQAKNAGLNVVHGECIMMFLEPVTSVHSFHRWFKKLVRAYPT